MFNKVIKSLRIDNSYSQVELARLINKTPRTIRKYEAGEIEPTLSVLISLSNIFNVSIDYLAGLTDNPEINR